MRTEQLSAEDRNVLAISMLKDIIRVQNMRIKLADKRNNDVEWLKAYEISTICEEIKSILDGTYDMEK